MIELIKRIAKRLWLIVLSLFNTIIAIPYFLVFTVSQAAKGKPGLLIVVLGVIGLALLWIFKAVLPAGIGAFLTNVMWLLTILAVLAVIWFLISLLKGFWRIVATAVFLLAVFVLYNFLKLDLADPIANPVPLESPLRIAAIETIVAGIADPAEKEAARNELEKEWEVFHEQYYQTSQGNQIFPYKWFLALEQRPHFGMIKNTDPYLSDDNLTRYRVLTGEKSKWNPDGMPIGIPKDIDKFTGEETMSISCASCHTGQFSYRGKNYRVEGAPSLQDFTYTEDMINALVSTVAVSSKFDRFAKKVLGEEYGEAGKRTLKAEVEKYIGQQAYGFLAQIEDIYPTAEGFGRVDALGRGANGQFQPLSKENVKVSDGPVSFPPIWYTHDYDWVQSPSAIQAPLGRNMTEAWGVNARIYFEKFRRFETTLKPQNLFWMETYVSLLEPPEWPEEILGKIDWNLAKRGQYLYEEATWEGADKVKELPAEDLFVPDLYDVKPEWNGRDPEKGLCARCHEPQWAQLNDIGIQQWYEQYDIGEVGKKRIEDGGLVKGRHYVDIGGAGGWEEFKKLKETQDVIREFKEKRYVKLRIFGNDVMGTDPNDAVNFNARQTSYYQIATGELRDYFGKEQVGVAEALKKLTTEAKNRVYDDLDLDLKARADWDGFRPNNFRAPLGYPARPLRGYWATAPYLHSGSIPDMYQLLSPVEERDKVFYIGSTTYDPKKLGYSTANIKGAFKFDTSVPGNSNAGHEFRNVPDGEEPGKGVIGPELTHHDRMAIIEYLKVLKDIGYDPNPDDPVFADWEKEDLDAYIQYRKEENVRRWYQMANMEFDTTTGLWKDKAKKPDDSAPAPGGDAGKAPAPPAPPAPPAKVPE